MSFLDLYQGDQAQAATIQPNEGHDLPSTFGENFHAAWGDGLLFSQSVAQQNARAAVLDDYASEVKQKTGYDINSEDVPSGPEAGVTGTFDRINTRVADLKAKFPDLDLNPLSEDEINQRAVAKAQATHRNYEALQAGERTAGGGIGSFLGSAASSAVDPVNLVALAVAPETGGASILGAALRWGALAGVSQAAIEASSNTFKEQVQPGYNENGQPIKEVAGAFVGGAVLGGGFKALGNAWTRVKTGAWPTSVRDAGNVIESEANIAETNPLPGAAGEVAHRDALVKTIDNILAGRPVDVGQQITPEMEAHFDAYHGSPHDFDAFDTSKIGTGEGAQAYGHGLYFAENEKVAEGYADRLGTSKISNDDLISGNYELGPNGNTYRVKITANKEHMLDWDRPFSEQTPEVQQSMRAAAENYLKTNPDDYHDVMHAITADEGADTFYERLADALKTGKKLPPDENGFYKFDQGHPAASAALSDVGIPGIRYFDQGSRDSGDGTHNFVMFDDKHVHVTHKNGKPVNAEIRQGIIDQAAGLPPKEPELPLNAPAPQKRAVEVGPQPVMQTAEEMNKTLTGPDHQDAIRADIDRERALGDFKVPGVDENGNHTMVGVDAVMDEVDAYKQAAEQIQACANPAQEAE